MKDLMPINTNLMLPETRTYDICYWKGDNCVLELVPGSIKQRMLDNKEQLIYLLGLPESALQNMVRPSSHLNMLRKRFWERMDIAVSTNTVIEKEYLCSGLTTWAGFEQMVATLGNLAWLLYPPVDYDAILEEAHTQSLAKMREILSLPVYDVAGRPDLKLMNLMLKIHEKLDLRLHGQPTKNVNMQKKSVNLNLHRTESPANEGKSIDNMSKEEIEREILKLKQERAKATFDPEGEFSVIK